MPNELDEYYSKVVLPCKGFNLWHYMSCASPMAWDFDKIRAELARIEEAVAAIKKVTA